VNDKYGDVFQLFLQNNGENHFISSIEPAERQNPHVLTIICTECLLRLLINTEKIDFFSIIMLKSVKMALYLKDSTSLKLLKKLKFCLFNAYSNKKLKDNPGNAFFRSARS